MICRRYSEPRKNIPNIPAVPSTWTRFEPVTLREAKMRSGISGCRAVFCRTMNPASRPSVSPASQPRWAAGPTMVYTASIIAPVISSAPGTSAPARRPAPRSRAMVRRAAMAVITPTGRLTKKIQCQFSAWVRIPPASSPTAAPAEATKANTPIAWACSRGPGNMVTIMPRITAEVSAPPVPCANRAAMSISWFTANPQTSEAAVNTASPVRNTSRRPARSPSRPASSSSPANAIRYALTTHASPAWEKRRPAWMDGSATFTIVMSSTIISIPVHSTTRAIQRERSFMGLPLTKSVHCLDVGRSGKSPAGRGPDSVCLPSQPGDLGPGTEMPAGHGVHAERASRCRAAMGQTGVMDGLSARPEDRPADFGAPPGGVGGVALADEVVLADRAVDGESVACDVCGQGAVGAVDVGGRPGVLDDRQFGGGDLCRRDPARRRDGPGAGDEDGHLTAVAGEHLIGVDAARGAARGHVLRGQGGMELAERALQPGCRLPGADDASDRGRGDGGHAAQLDAGGHVAGRGRCQQGAQRGDGPLRSAEFFLQAAEMGNDPLVAGAQVGSGQHALNLLQRHAQVTEAADDLRGGDLAGSIAPLAGVRIDLGRLEEADLMVVAQRPDGHVGGAREVADRQVPRHAAHYPGCRRGRVFPR